MAIMHVRVYGSVWSLCGFSVRLAWVFSPVDFCVWVCVLECVCVMRARQRDGRELRASLLCDVWNPPSCTAARFLVCESLFTFQAVYGSKSVGSFLSVQLWLWPSRWRVVWPTNNLDSEGESYLVGFTNEIVSTKPQKCQAISGCRWESSA